jgi:hypothetical protein
MRTELALLSLVGLLTACPGELSNKAAFEAYAATHGDAGAPSDEAGSSGSSSMAGTASTAPGGSAGTVGNDGCGDVVARIFVPSCGGVGCHGASAPQQDLDLVSAGIAARVVGVSAKQCLKVLADPQNPEQSLLYQKLLARPDCGAQMPLARPALSSADIACVLSWIAAQ